MEDVNQFKILKLSIYPISQKFLDRGFFVFRWVKKKFCRSFVSKQTRYFRALGGVKIFFSFFLILAINMQNQKKCSKWKNFLFLFRTFWEKKLSHFINFVDFRHKKPPFFPIFFLPPIRFFRLSILGWFQQSKFFPSIVESWILTSEVDRYTSGTLQNPFC